jgi:hypothetical protein
MNPLVMGKLVHLKTFKNKNPLLKHGWIIFQYSLDFHVSATINTQIET